jgi:hypothetical protein
VFAQPDGLSGEAVAWPRAVHVNPVLPAQCQETHRILRQVIAQFKFRIFYARMRTNPAPDVSQNGPYTDS